MHDSCIWHRTTKIVCIHNRDTLMPSISKRIPHLVMSVRCSLTSFSRHCALPAVADGDIHHLYLPAGPPETPCRNSLGSVRGISPQPLSSIQDGSSASDQRTIILYSVNSHCNINRYCYKPMYSYDQTHPVVYAFITPGSSALDDPS